MAIVLVKTARRTHIRNRSSIFKFQRVNFQAIVTAVGNIYLRLVAERSDPDAVACFEFSMLCSRSTYRFQMFEIPVKSIEQLTAIAIDDVDIAVRGDGDVGGIR